MKSLILSVATLLGFTGAAFATDDHCVTPVRASSSYSTVVERVVTAPVVTEKVVERVVEKPVVVERVVEQPVSLRVVERVVERPVEYYVRPNPVVVEAFVQRQYVAPVQTVVQHSYRQNFVQRQNVFGNVYSQPVVARQKQRAAVRGNGLFNRNRNVQRSFQLNVQRSTQQGGY
jgi:hypothetical protein